MRNPAKLFYPRGARLGFHATKTQGGSGAIHSAAMQAPHLHSDIVVESGPQPEDKAYEATGIRFAYR
jgi:hypothetical protein